MGRPFLAPGEESVTLSVRVPLSLYSALLQRASIERWDFPELLRTVMRLGLEELRTNNYSKGGNHP